MHAHPRAVEAHPGAVAGGARRVAAAAGAAALELLHEFTDHEDVVLRLTWSPDGKHIAVWTFKTFEFSYYTAIAIVPSNPAQPIALTNNANIWPLDKEGHRISGGRGNMTWQ